MTPVAPIESTAARRIRVSFEFFVVAICTLSFVATLLSIGASLLSPNSAGTRDYVEYWAAGQQLAHRSNPYDGEAIRSLELSAGFPSTAPTLYLGNPPSALLLVMPLGYVSPTVGEFLWEAMLLASLILAIRLTNRMIQQHLGCEPNKAYLIAYAFAPALTCLLGGQIAILLLFGLALFLRLHERSPFFAGCTLWLCLLKPHLFVPFGIVLVLWIIQTRRYKVLLGTATALAISSAIATLLDHGIWTHYRLMMHTQRIDQLDLPTISAWLRRSVPPHTFAIQCIPVILGAVWSIFYFRKHRHHWNWLSHGLLLTLVSVVVAPYVWLMDQTVLIPALLLGIYSTRSRVLIALLALASAVLEIAALRGAGLYSAWYFFTAPAWLAFYLIASRLRVASRPRVASQYQITHVGAVQSVQR
jgi:hypothetical protein